MISLFKNGVRDESFYQIQDVDEQRENRWTLTSGYEEKHKSNVAQMYWVPPTCPPTPNCLSCLIYLADRDKGDFVQPAFLYN